MVDKQAFAKIAIFLLLGVNVAAYYYFWPHHDNGVKNAPQGPREEKGQVTLLPEERDDATPPAKPKELPAITLVDAAPLSIPNAPAPAKMENPAVDPLVKLLDHIQREKDEVKNLLPAFPPLPGEKPQPLPPIPSTPLNPEFGVTSPLTPKQPAKAWSWKAEQFGVRTVLIAKLPEIEFRIVCDRVSEDPNGNEVAGLGNVTTTGAGMCVECRRVRLPLRELRLVFEEQVVVTRPAGMGLLRGERFVWELPTNAPAANVILGPPN